MDNDLLGVAFAREEGFDVTTFYPVGNLYLGIVVPGSSDAKTPADLKGRKWAISVPIPAPQCSSA